MTYNLVFLKFNNYYNRRIKRYKTISEYQNAYEWYSDTVTRNIDYNDGINISIVVNNTTSLNSMGYNYIIALESDSSEINSRWFILEEKQTRQGQWVMQLRRDLVSDFLESFMSSTTYIEKGRLIDNIVSISNINPLAFNQEQFTANQIKKSETLLKDQIGCKWIVGYLNKGYLKDGSGAEQDKTILSFKNESFQPEEIISSLSSVGLDKCVESTRYYPTSLTARFGYDLVNQQGTHIKYRRVDASVSSTTVVDADRSYGGEITRSLFREDDTPWPQGLSDYYYTDMFDYIYNKYNTLTMDVNQWLYCLGLNDKIIYVQDQQKYYKVNITRHGAYGNFLENVNPNVDPIWYNSLKAFAEAALCVVPLTPSAHNFDVILTFGEGISATLTEVNQAAYTATISTNHNRTIGEAFDAFAIPYVEDKPIYIDLESVFSGKIQDTSAALAVAQEMLDVSSEALDLQLLPYCPLPNSMLGSYKEPGDDVAYPSITVAAADVPYAATVITNLSGNEVNAIFWLSSTQFTKIIPYTDTNDYSSLDKIKAINQLDLWRLSSGDYSSSFEFNMACNGGVLYFEVDCAYKPYQPYIHVAPNFGGLYGRDYNDTRGLICSNTNYSLPRLTDAWETYERNNLNYMNSFNRQIQKMDTDRKYQRGQEIVGAVSGALSGGGTGALIGSMVAPGIGTAVGAIVGGAASIGAGIADVAISEQLYKENKKYANDQFNMSLENIRALPNTLAAVGALNPNNKVFPILEHYSCSDLEKEAFLNKLRWNGMSINVIGNPVDYIDTTRDCYFKGQIINIDIDGPAHEAGELAVEIAKGVIFERSI